MFTKTAFIAAALLAGSTLVANADSMIHDSNTGLEARYYYDTLENLARQGLPISDSARKYLSEHGGTTAARAQARQSDVRGVGKRGNVFLLEQRPVYGGAPYEQSNDIHRPW